jgi:2-methylcitrate dehydratase PrpD
MQANYARLCFQYAGALALANGAVDLPDFRPDRLTEPQLQAVGRRIEVAIDDNPDANALAPQTVIARLKNGCAYTVDVPHTLGSPQRPLTQDQYLDKFRRCLSYGIRPLAADAPARVIDLIDRLDDLDNTNDLITALCPIEC